MTNTRIGQDFTRTDFVIVDANLGLDSEFGAHQTVASVSLAEELFTETLLCGIQ